ncbi:MAG TPA: lysylphosphatidylglycerol synthase transmembrane domain-containing protein [Gaiellaceae bacterium]
MKLHAPRSRTGRVALVVPFLAAVVALLVWRGPDLGLVEDAFTIVAWSWVAVAVLINLASIVVRSSAWKVVVDQAVAPPRPRNRTVFSAFSIGLLGNAALPGRVGEIARVMVLTRRMRRRPGTWATVVGTVFAHRMFDVVAAIGLVVYVLYAARLPHWAVPALAIVLGIGIGALIAGTLLVHYRTHTPFEQLGPVRRVLRLARHGLEVLKRPGPALAALSFQLLGWTFQLFAVWAALKAFRIDAPISAAAVVLVLMNLATIVPLWPGNFGLVQAAVALPLLSYGVEYAHGFAFGIGLQAIEASVGIGLGLIFLAREGFSFAMLKRMPEVTEVELDERVERIA